MMSLHNARVIRSEPLHKDGQWIKIVKLTYLDPMGQQRTWESAERTTRSKSGVDGVGILVLFDHLPTGTEILLQKQFRAPLGKVTIELPAGLIDEGEDIQQAAVRELKEESGYLGSVIETSPIMYNDPGMTNTNTAICTVHIDMSHPDNQNPLTSHEDDEFIESFTIPVTSLYEKVKEFEREGFAIDARVGSFAQGIELAKKMKL
ncbi:NUDIX domain-containing protein [Xylariaceae sp. FL1272]|nr:NUDIX domain-containing protein [Xylariaceae sp. FL1272]